MEENVTWNYSVGIAPPSAKLAQKIELHGLLTIIPFGIILNAATFDVFYIMKSHRTSTGLHLIVLFFRTKPDE